MTDDETLKELPDDLFLLNIKLTWFYIFDESNNTNYYTELLDWIEKNCGYIFDKRLGKLFKKAHG